MGLLFINQCALVWTGLWPIFSILQLWVLNVLMASLYQQMMKEGKVKRSTQQRVFVFVCVCLFVQRWRCVYCMSETGIVETE